MTTFLGVDMDGVVRLVSNSRIPNVWNGIVLRCIELDDAAHAAFHALPGERAGTHFDGEGFRAIEHPAPTQERPGFWRRFVSFCKRFVSFFRR